MIEQLESNTALLLIDVQKGVHGPPPCSRWGLALRWLLLHQLHATPVPILQRSKKSHPYRPKWFENHHFPFSPDAAPRKATALQQKYNPAHLCTYFQKLFILQ